MVKSQLYIDISNFYAAKPGHELNMQFVIFATSQKLSFDIKYLGGIGYSTFVSFTAQLS